MDVERLDRWCERILLALVLAILVLGPLAIGAVRPQEFLIIQGLSLVALVVWGARLWLNPRPKLLWPPVCWGVISFVIYAIARYQFADVEYPARQELIRVLIYAVLFFIILNNCFRQESIQIISMTLLALATAVSLYALYQFLTDSPYVWRAIKPDAYRGRGSGTFIYPNALAGFLEMLFPIGVAYLLMGRFKPLTKVLIGYACLAIFTGIAVSLSRGSWIAASSAMLVFSLVLIRLRDYRWQALLLLSLFVAGGALFFTKGYHAQKRTRDLLAMPAVEQDRYMLWNPALQMWRDHYWWGVGPGHFDLRFKEYRLAHDRMQVRPDRVHNDYLNTLTDWGLVGAILVAVPWALFYLGVIRGWKHVQRAPTDLGTKRSTRMAFVFGASIGLLAILLHSFVDFNMHVPANAILIVALMALAASHGRFATESYWVSLRWPGKLLATLVIAGAGVYLGEQGWRRAQEQYWLQRAASTNNNAMQRVDALKQAFDAAPSNFETAWNIGETYRALSWQNQDGYRDLANSAMAWFERCTAANRFYTYGYLHYGMCRDWIGEHGAAEPYYQQAVKLDPNGYYTRAWMGWHYVQKRDYAEAKRWFQRSLEVNWTFNPIASSYWEIVNRKLAEPPEPNWEQPGK